MIPTASIAADFGAAMGVFATTIAVVGFLAHATPVLRGASDEQVRYATVIGGLVGCVASVFVVVLSALSG
jgi:hypothetical protein